MRISYYQVDAFTSRLFGGNYAGVCPLEKWLPDDVMQNIAMENNLPETVFFVPEKEGFRIRWFTPEVEMDLCGHATLAAAFVLRTCENYTKDTVFFYSISGPLTVSFKGDDIFMDFPARPGETCSPEIDLSPALGFPVMELYKSRDYMAVMKKESDILNMKPDISLLEKMGVGSLIVTAPGDNCDYVTRFFAPGMGIPEDPATGSAQCTLIPYWSRRLNKKDLSCIQLSTRKGEFQCRDEGSRVKIGGRCCLFLAGEIYREA